MRLYSILVLTLAGLVILAGAQRQDDSSGNTDLADGVDGTDAIDATDAGNTQSVGGADDGADDDTDDGTDDGSGTAGDNGDGNYPSSGGGGDGNMPSGMMDFFRGKGPFGGWPGFASGGQSGGPPGQLRARSFRFGNDKYIRFDRRGFGGLGGFRNHQHSPRDDVQNSGPSFNSVWYGGSKINLAS